MRGGEEEGEGEEKVEMREEGGRRKGRRRRWEVKERMVYKTREHLQINIVCG